MNLKNLIGLLVKLIEAQNSTQRAEAVAALNKFADDMDTAWSATAAVGDTIKSIFLRKKKGA